MKHFAETMLTVYLLTAWVFGIAASSGFEVFFAIICPPFSWYKLAEYIL